MPATKNQALRLEILDELLATKKWTIDELLNRVNQQVDTNQNPIDKRTLFRDIKYLSEEKGAPIHRPEKKDNLYYYTEKFSLKNIPLDEDDVASLKNAIQLLKQVDNFAILNDVEDVIRKLENRIHTPTTRQEILVQFEKHTSSSGHEYMNELLEAIKSKVPLRITYQPYSHPTAHEKVVHPYLLKEFRNRWFLFGRDEGATRLTNYALDRIKKLKTTKEVFIENDLFDPEEYFKHLIGVSVSEGAQPESIEIKVQKPSVPYIRSKPIHRNQETLKVYKDGTILIRLNLIINYELKSILLSYGAGIEVKKPKKLRVEMMEIIEEMKRIY